MSSQFERTELLIGKKGVERLAAARVAIFGIGGVGGYALEALARSGVGNIDLVDNDIIGLTNLNRQIIATHGTLGKYKVDVARERVLDINPSALIKTYKLFYSEENSDEMDLKVYDYIIDAIDTVKSKVELIVRAKAEKITIISSMGAGNKMNPTMFFTDDIYNTSVCPLAKVMRRELRQRGIEKLKVVYSKETPIKVDHAGTVKTPGSNSFVPPACGLTIASEVIKDLLNK